MTLMHNGLMASPPPAEQQSTSPDAESVGPRLSDELNMTVDESMHLIREQDEKAAVRRARRPWYFRFLISLG